VRDEGERIGTVRVLRLPTEAVYAPSLEVLKARLDEALGSLV